MSEEQQKKPADAWGQPISEERQARLRGYLDRWAAEKDHGERKGPFQGVEMSGADVSWLAEQSGRGLWAGVPNLHLEGTILHNAHLEEALLGDAHLEGAILTAAHLQESRLDYAHMEGAHLGDAHLEGAILRGTHLEEAFFGGAHLEGASLFAAHLERSVPQEAHLEGADLRDARLEGAHIEETHLEGADLRKAQLQGAHLQGAYLEGADLTGAFLGASLLYQAHLEGAKLGTAHLEGANLTGAFLGGKFYSASDADIERIRRWSADFPATLAPADLRGAFFDSATDFTQTTWVAVEKKSAGPSLADVRWGGANLTVVDWEQVQALQDERVAATAHATKKSGNQTSKPRLDRVTEYQAAGSRAYRLLFVALRNQGLGTPATRYHYRAEVMDRKALWHRRRYTRWLFSWLLGTFAGYGDYIGRLFITYGVVIVAFALAMFAFSARTLSPDSIGDVLILSVTSFHGRGVQPPGLHLTDILAAFSGVEAVFGLLIEGLFIAAFTRRVTGG